MMNGIFPEKLKQKINNFQTGIQLWRLENMKGIDDLEPSEYRQKVNGYINKCALNNSQFAEEMDKRRVDEKDIQNIYKTWNEYGTAGVDTLVITKENYGRRLYKNSKVNKDITHHNGLSITDIHANHLELKALVPGDCSYQVRFAGYTPSEIEKRWGSVEAIPGNTPMSEVIHTYEQSN
ncbi:MAG: hypothetical protein FWE45_03310 [Firmicutes bacterium]|nr:hypothetical protein [Bacillota bacterium]